MYNYRVHQWEEHCACQVSHSLLCDGVVVKEDATVCSGSVLSFKVQNPSCTSFLPIQHGCSSVLTFVDMYRTECLNACG